MMILRDQAITWKKQNKKNLHQLRRSKSLTRDLNDLHDMVFAHTNCLDCANCCKTTGPLFTSRDIRRISKALGMIPSAFERAYLRVDEDGDHVLKSVPCTFLDGLNMCKIYDVRPKACREYPHTDMKQQHKIFDLTLKNAEICPAVLEMLQNLSRQT